MRVGSDTNFLSFARNQGYGEIGTYVYDPVFGGLVRGSYLSFDGADFILYGSSNIGSVGGYSSVVNHSRSSGLTVSSSGSATIGSSGTTKLWGSNLHID